MAQRTVPVVFVLAAFAFACSGEKAEPGGGAGGAGGEEAPCVFQACGGDLVGRWKVVRRCPGGERDFAQCEDAVETEEMVREGGWNFQPNGTYRHEMWMQGTAHFAYDDGCTLAMTGGAYDAYDYCNVHRAQVWDDPALDGTCVSADGVCTCDITYEAEHWEESGNWEVDGDELLVGRTPRPYCVSGDTLTFSWDGWFETYERVPDSES